MPVRRPIEFERRENGCLVCVSHKTRTNGYTMVRPPNTTAPQLLHRIVWEEANGPIPQGMWIDHRCQNRECCEVTHLRLATPAQNSQYTGPQKTTTTGFKGVTYCKRAKKFVAQIQANGRHMNLGMFSDPESAAHKYDAAAIQYHGEFSVTNRALGLI